MNQPGVVLEATVGSPAPGFQIPRQWQELDPKPAKRIRTKAKEEDSPDTSEVIVFSRTEFVVYRMQFDKTM